jgi:hypothetical protein
MSQVQNKSLNEGKTAAAPGPKRPLSLWRNRDYVLLWSGQTVSSIGTQVSLLAFPLLILAITHSPAQAGIVAALHGLPYALFILPAGAGTLRTTIHLVHSRDFQQALAQCPAHRGTAIGVKDRRENTAMPCLIMGQGISNCIPGNWF